MPLRDHFRPPIYPRKSWEGFHGGWPMVLVQHLVPLLPPNYSAEPRVHLGTMFEVDIAAFEDDVSPPLASGIGMANGGVAAAPWALPQSTLTAEADFPDQYEYEVLIYDEDRMHQLVAVVKIVSPANKDRPSHRRQFVSRCIALLRKGVCVSMIDFVTAKNFNLFQDVLAEADLQDPTFGPHPPPIYAATCRRRLERGGPKVDSWAFPLAVGEPLPALPVWLDDHLAVSLDLERAYEELCHTLKIA